MRTDLHRKPIGEYEHPDDKWLVEVARSAFLEHVKDLKREVLMDLREEQLKLYQTARLQFRKISFVEWPESDPDQEAREIQERWTTHFRDYPTWSYIEHNSIAHNGALQKLRGSLFSWTEIHHLNAAWCRERAYLTLEQWSAYPDTAEMGWCRFPVMREGLAGTGMPMGFDWGITTEKSSQYLDWITEQARYKLENDPLLSIVERSHREGLVRQVRKEAKKCCDALKGLAKLYGFKEVNWSELNKHALWAAKRQIVGETLEQIAKKDGVSKTAVSNAVRAFLSRVELPERPFKGAGRPRSK
jgi:hypothetical protein